MDPDSPATAPSAPSLRDILDSISDGILTFGASLRATSANAASQDILGYSERRILGQTPEALGFDDATCRLIRRAAAEAVAGVMGGKVARPGIAPRAVTCAVDPLRTGPSGQVVGALVRFSGDAEHSAFDAALSRRHLQETIHAMAAGLAHEIRNPLTGVKGALALLGRKTYDAQLLAYVHVGEREIERIETLLRRLQESGGVKDIVLGPVNLFALIDSIIAAAEVAEYARDVRFERQYDVSLPEVTADAAWLGQAVLNLVKNAAEAARTAAPPHRVRIGVQPGRRLAFGNAPARGTVRLMVEDSGPGIPAEGRDRVFAPFFTTKPRGTGIGLALVQSIAAAHGGMVECGESALGGAMFTLLLPIL